MKWLSMWRERRYEYSHPPMVEISMSGQMTSRPQVHASVTSRRGAQTVYTFDATEQGIASAQMHGKSLAHLLNVGVYYRDGLQKGVYSMPARGDIKGEKV